MLEGNETKRKRLSLACNVCRRKKIKCDGIKPKCGKCARQDQECSYTSSMKKRGPKQGHIESLEQRLKKMEEIVASGINKTTKIPKKTLPEESLPPLEYNDITTLPKIFTQPIPSILDTLPDSDVVEHLVEIFFQNFTATIPIVDIEGFRSSVRNNTCNMFLLYSIMAVAARFSNRSDIVQSPLWMSGEKYAVKARSMLDQVIENPCTENIQGLLILIMNEYGCARGPRCWMYTGIAVRMVIEIGLHREKILEEGHNSVIPLERWYWYETRRKIFWNAFINDKFSSASTGRPGVLNPEDCEIMLPVDFNVLASTSGNDFYQASLDKTKLVHYHIIRDSSTNIITGIQMNPLDVNHLEHRVYFNRIGCISRIVQGSVLLGKVTCFVNRKSKNVYEAYEENSEFEKLDNELDVWEKELPLNMKNTQVNLEKYRNLDTVRSGQYILGHILYNSLVILLNRPSLAIIDLPATNQITHELQEKVHKSVEKCLSATDNITVMLKDLCCQIQVIPPFISYSVYTASTVVVNSIFSMTGQGAQKAELALKEYFHFFSVMKVYWAMADKLYFLICDLYAIHQKVLNTCKKSQISTVSTKPWNNDLFMSPYTINPGTPLKKKPYVDITSSGYDFTNNSYWNTQHERGVFHFRNEQGRTKSIFSDPSNRSLSIPSFDIWIRQHQQEKQDQNRSSSSSSLL